MSLPAVKWRHVEKYFLRRGYSIYSDGGDKIIVAPPDLDPRRKRQIVRIGHRFCKSAGCELSKGHLGQIKRAFGVTRAEILAG